MSRRRNLWNIYRWSQINNLRYADDTTIIADSAADIQNILERMNVVSIKYGLYINCEKTKLMSINSTTTNPVTLDGAALEVVETFNYLGAQISANGGCTREIRCRLGQARRAMADLSCVWSNRHIRREAKMKLVKCLIFPIATYACENWSLSAPNRNRIDAFEMWCWRRMLRIPWTAHRTNESVLVEIGHGLTLRGSIACRAMKYFGHIARRDSQNLEKAILQGAIEGRRSRGRPARRYIDELKEIAGFNNVRALYDAAMNRHSWRKLSMDSARRLR